MPARRLLMRKIREVLRLRHELGLPHQAVARASAVGVGTVNRYLRRAAEGGLGWPLPTELDDAALEARLFPRAAPVHDRVRPDCAHIHRELKRDGVTLPAPPRAGRGPPLGPLHHNDRRGLLQGPPRGLAPAAPRRTAVHRGRAHAQRPSSPRRVVAVAPHPVGREGRAGDR